MLTKRNVNGWRRQIVIWGTVLVGNAWLLALFFSEGNLVDGLGLALAQSALTFLALGVLMFGQTSYAAGPSWPQMMALHVLIYYGLSNVTPALLPSLRPQSITELINYRIPQASISSFTQATVAAFLLLLGIELGSRIARRRLLIRLNEAEGRSRRYAWLPEFQLSLISAIFIFIVFVIGTGRYGLAFSNSLTDQTIADYSLIEQSLFHGLFWFFPVAPMLAASACIRAVTPRQRRLARRLLVVIMLGTVGGLFLWRTRSMAMIAGVLPIVLLMYAGVIKWQRSIIPAVLLGLVVYVGVTSIRINLEDITNSTGGRSFDVNDLAAVLSRFDAELIGGKMLSDVSYRTAGLEGVAAIIQAQDRGYLERQMGKVLVAGFEQALPASLRGALENPERVKSAPSYLGVFLPGDWVTTFLAELTLDYGALWLLFPAALIGLFVGGLDALWVRMGQTSALGGLLVLRIPFLLYPLTIGSSFADMTLLFWKATVGYWVLLLLIGIWTRVRVTVRSTGQWPERS